MRHQIRILSVIALLVLTAVGVAWAQEAEENPCAMCHDDLAAAFAQTIHGLSSRGGPTCQTCHGDGVAHMDEGGDPALISKPTAAICRSCHDRRDSDGIAGREVHLSNGVDCFSCHTIHHSANDRQPLLVKPVDKLCVSCHGDKRIAMNRPYGHRLDRAGVVSCVSCHDPHAGRENHGLKMTRDGDLPCFNCHAEKRGPFVFEHGARRAGNDCMSCHDPHGSNNPHALKRSQVAQLCFECHSPISGNTLGSQPPSRHDLTSPRYRNCTVCHVAIHGSNSSPAFMK